MNSTKSIGAVPNTKSLPTVRGFPALSVTTADQDFRITGITKDRATGAVLGSCVVHLFLTASDQIQTIQTSDAVTGVYSIAVQPSPTQYYAVGYKAGSPDVAGTTVNTLTGI